MTTPGVQISVSGGGGGGPINCTAAQGITGATHLIDVTWGVTAQSFTSQAGGFGPNDAVVIRFTTPGNSGTLTKKGLIAGAEYGDAPNTRYGTMSTQPCDFPATTASPTSALPIIGGGPPPTEVFCGSTMVCGTAVNFSWAFSASKTGAAQVQAGTTYYINIANQVGSCTANGSCNMIFNWTWPSQ
jgi:hypothetical protein